MSGLYGSRDPREAPVYSLAEAARHLHLPPATLRSWVFGRTYRLSDGSEGFSGLLIQRPDPEDSRLSFTNLVEAHVLHALRAHHRVPMKAVREALDYASRKLGISRLLIREELRAAPGELFLKEYGRLLSLSPAGQLAMERVLSAYLARVVHDAAGLPARLYPFTLPDRAEDRRVVAIDPRISYGRPMIARKGVSTSILTERLNAGDSIHDLAADYDLQEDEVEEAIVYEQAA